MVDIPDKSKNQKVLPANHILVGKLGRAAPYKLARSSRGLHLHPSFTLQKNLHFSINCFARSHRTTQAGKRHVVHQMYLFMIKSVLSF